MALLRRILRPSTARRLGFWVLLGSVCVLAASLTLVLRGAQSTMLRSSGETLEALAIASANAVAARTGSVEMTAHIVAATIGRHLDNPDFIETLIAETVVAHPDIRGVAAAFEPGAVRGESPEYAPFVVHQGTIALRRDLADDPGSYRDAAWYRRAKACEHGCWGELFHSQSRGELLINYGVPIRDASNHIAGVVNVDVQQHWLQSTVDSVRPGPASFAFLLGERGILLADAKPERIAMSIFDLAGNSKTPELADAARRMLAGTTGSADYLSPTIGIPVRTYFTPIPDSPWSIAIVVPREEYVRDSQRIFFDTAAIGSIGLALLGLLVWLAVRRLLAPLGQLVEKAAHIARGELDFRLDPPRRMDEVGRLTESFIGMRDRLKQHIAELTDATAARERLQSELEIARHIQESMLPESHPAAGTQRFDLQALLRPAKVVGGDLYSYVSRNDDRLCFLIGDVSDKGIPAALLMARTITLANARASGVEHPEDLLRLLNVELCAGNDSCMFVTMLCGILDLATGKLALASAGHDSPIRIGRHGAVSIAAETGTALGLDEDATYPRLETRLAAGESIVLFTDGVTEASDPDGSLYGEQRLLDALAGADGGDPAALIAAIVGSVTAFMRGDQPNDDLTLLALRWYGAAPRASALHLDLGVRLPEVEAALHGIDAWLASNAIDREHRDDARLALEELMVNTVSYGFPAGTDGACLKVALELDGGALHAAISDTGIAHDPFAQVAPDLDADDDGRPLGGLGVFLVTRLAEKFRYRRDGDWNRVKLQFNVQSASHLGRIEP